MRKVATFDFSGFVELDESEIWPDKDAPNDWTANDVARLLKYRWLSDWNMENAITVTVTVDGESVERPAFQ